MPTSLILACLWAIGANLLALMPSRDQHWRAAFALIVVGIPILGYVTWQTGPWVGLLCLIAATSMLRWLRRGGQGRRPSEQMRKQR